MTKKLEDKDIVRIMREEYNARLRKLSEDVDLTMNPKTPDGEKPVLSPELKVQHKKSGVKYTVHSVGPRDVILRTPEGEQFLVDQTELEDEYSLS